MNSLHAEKTQPSILLFLGQKPVQSNHQSDSELQQIQTLPAAMYKDQVWRKYC